MERLTSNEPKSNFETLMNFCTAKNGVATLCWADGEENTPLHEYAAKCCCERGCEQTAAELLENGLECDCPIAAMYYCGAQAAENNARLKVYEDTGLEPEDCAEYKKFEDELINSGKSFKHVLELLSAEKDGRCVVLPSKNDEIVHAVEVALGIKLYDWQKAYIFGASNYRMPGRCTGLTTAYILKVLLSDGPPICLYKRDVLEAVCDERHGSQYYDIFASQMKNVYYELSNPGLRLKLRKVYFSEKEDETARNVCPNWTRRITEKGMRG